MYRIGLGSDIHPFKAGRKLVLGGVEIEYEKGLLGHSDADVVLHALCDALLGASSLGDLGEHFPADESNKDRPSTEILAEVCRKIWDRGLSVVNADIVIMAEEPKLDGHRDAMREIIATILNVDKFRIGVKATTCDKLGAIGRNEGIFAQAVVLLQKTHES